MRIEAKLTGLDELKDIIQSNIKDSLVEVGKEAVEYAKQNGEYMNHTFNLRNAPGAGVVMDGELKETYVPADGKHEEAKAKTEATIEKSLFPGTGLIIEDGMPYSSFVEAKGYDVVGGAALEADRILNDKTRS